MMILVLGEILFDELPQGRRPGGAPFNFAQHLNRLGQDVQFVSSIGRDQYGVELLKILLGANLNPNLVQRQDNAPTGRVSVTLDQHGVPEYDLVPNVAYDAIDFSALPPLHPELVYFGSLIQRTASGRERLQAFLRTLPESVLRFYDVNFRTGCATADILIPSLKQTDILKLNDDELPMVGKLTGSDLSGDKLVDWILDAFTIQQVALTRGANGCALYRNGTKTEAPPGPLRKEEIADTVGAGDAFSAMLTHCILNGTDADHTLQRCTQLAEFICTLSGAVPADDTFYQALQNERMSP